MHRQLVIFGCEDAAELAYFYFQNDSSYEVVGFSVDSEFIQTETFSGKPLVPYEDVVSHYPPEKYSFFIALGYSKLNSIRKEKYLSA